ncbi:MAG: LicD family protein [Clostridiales bacterium]|nr:LicD family protein [Clostridiales bacterium]
MEKLKQIELNIFCEFIKICEELNLKYYVIGGTLLGAVRHKGFIPWDDDIDVCMMRDDYDIFVQKAQKILHEKYFVQTLNTEPNCPFNFCKIRDSETTFIEESIGHLNMNHGVYIDIFPLDYYPTNKREKKCFERKSLLYKILIAKIFYVKKESIIKKIKRNFIRIGTFFYPYKFAVKKREVLYKSVKNSSLVANLSGAWGEKEIFPKEWFGDGVVMEFEGVKVKAPKEYDYLLTQMYGDYMIPPRKEKQVAHHHCSIIDLDKSYKEYFK